MATMIEPRQTYPNVSYYDSKAMVVQIGEPQILPPYDSKTGIFPDPNASCCVKLATAKLPDEDPDKDQLEFIEDEHSTFPQHVKTNFNEMFLEPREVKGWPAIVTVNGMVYHYTKVVTYRILHVLLGWLLAFAWGLSLGIITFSHVWIVQPSLKIALIYIRLASVVVNAILRMVLDPVARAFSLLLSRIGGKLSLDVTGINRPQTKFVESP